MVAQSTSILFLYAAAAIIIGLRRLPEHIKRQAAPDMLRGVEWHYHGRPVENPVLKRPEAGKGVSRSPTAQQCSASSSES